MLRSAIIIALLAVADSAAGGHPKKCIGPAEKIKIEHGGQSVEVGAPQLKAALMKALGDGTKAAFKKNQAVKELVEGKKDCQFSCVGHVIRNSIVPLVWGTGMVKLPESQQQEIGIQALTGAIKTCYPGIKRELVLGFAKEISNHMDTSSSDAQSGDELKLDIEGKCQGPAGAPKDAAQQFAKFAATLGPAAEKVLDEPKFASLKSYVSSSDSFQCQQMCAFGPHGTIAMSLHNLWSSGLIGAGNGRDMAIESFTGALKTCYPTVPHNYVHGYVEAVMDTVDGELDKVTRLYPSVGIPHIAAKQAAVANTIPMVNIVAFTIVTFGVGMTVGRFALGRGKTQHREARDAELE